MTALPHIEACGLFFIADPHLSATPPGQRLEGYLDQVLAKVRACLERARQQELYPVFLGDLFHWPRENPNNLLVELIEMFGPHHPATLVGNHDKYLARFTRDVSLAVLASAGVVRLLDAPGPAFWLEAPTGRVLVGASPDGSPLPRRVDRRDSTEVVWLAHHNLAFAAYPDKPVPLRGIDGVDWVVNGHIHRTQPTTTAGNTRYANPGNITRLVFSQHSKDRVPCASVWRPGCQDLELWPVPLEPFENVFPDQPFPSVPLAGPQSSQFVDGLERLAWRRTREGLGLKQFLSANLNPENSETQLIWELYQEVAGGPSKPS